MITLNLRGFAIPGPALPTFVIPYFGSAASNSVFAQELDERSRVTSFLSFEPAHFIEYMGPIPVAEIRVGDPGLVGYIDAGGKLTSGTAAELRRMLADYPFSPDGSDAFFATEVMEFRGDQAGLERAIDTAARRFLNFEHGMRWKAREITTRWGASALAPSPESVRKVLLRELRDAMGEPLWPSRFKEAWDALGPDPELGDLALNWLMTGGMERAEAGQLFNTLLTASAPKFKRPEEHLPRELVELAHRWVEQMIYPGNGWAALWHKLYRRRYAPASVLRDLGIRFLYVEPHERFIRRKRQSANGWMRVWRTLWADEVERSLLVTLLEERQDLFELSEFTRILELLSREPQFDGWVQYHLSSWLDRAPKHLPRWSKTCLDLIHQYNDRDRLVVAALNWLADEGVKLHAWYALWSGLRPYVDKATLAGLAREWLGRGQITMRIWPEVLVDLIEMDHVYTDEMLRPLAQQWLQLGKKNTRRAEIEVFASHPQAYGGKADVADQRLFLSYHFEADAWRVAQIRNALLSHKGVQVEAALEASTWDELKKDGHLAVETFLDNQLRTASVTIVLFGSSTASREWVRYEVMRSHQLGLGLIAVDIHRLPGADGQSAQPGPNPLSLWQADIAGQKRAFSDLYPTYDWVQDNGPRNVMHWISKVTPKLSNHRKASRLRD